MNSRRKFHFLMILIFSTMASTIAHAEMGIPVQLRLKNPSGTYPTESGVSIKLQVLTPSGGCILREEIFAGQTISDGNVSLVLGSGSAGSYDPGLTLNSVYDNSRSKTGLTCVNDSNVITGTGQTYNPTSIDQRLIRFTATVTGTPLVIDFNMKSIPYAIQAESVGGKLAADIIVNNATSQLNQTNLNNLLLDATRLTNLLDVAQNGNAQTADSATNFTGNLTGDVTGTQAATVVTRLRGVTISTTAPTSGQILVYNGSQYVPTNQATASLTLAGDVSGSLNANSVNSVGGKTSSQISQSVDDTLAATSSATAGTIVKRDGSGNASLNTITSLNNSTQNVYIYNASNANNVRLKSPTTFSNYVLTLPTTDGSANQVLQTDGSGNLDWFTIPTTGVQSVSATSPLVATGTTNINLSVNVGTTSGTVAAGNDSRIANALQTSTNFSGDVSGTYNTLVLANSGVAASTYTKVTVDSKGRVISGTNLTASDTPNLDTAKITSGTFPVARGGTGLSSVGSANQVLGANATGTGLEYKTITAGSNITVSNTAGVLTISASNSGGTLTNVSSANSYISIINPTTTPVITANIGITSGTLAAGNDSRILNALQTSSIFSGDVSGTAAANIVSFVGGKTSTQVSQSVSDTLAATSLNTINTIVKRNGSGGFNASSGVFESNVQVKDGAAGGAVTLQAPVGFTSYALTFPTTDGSANQVLQTNGSGVLSWVTGSTGSVTNVSSANTYLTVASSSTTPVITANVGTTSGTLAAGNDSRIANALQTSSIFSGDVSGTYNSLVLANSGVTAATYSKVTVDAKGRVTSGTSLVASDIPSLDTAKITSGTFSVARGGTGLSAVGSANQVLGTNAAGTGLEYKTITAGSNITVSNTAGVLTISSSNSGGTVTNVSSANAYLTVATSSTTPVLTLNVGTAANTVAAGNDSRIANALQTSTVFAGDISGTASAVSVDRIRGTNVLITSLVNNNILQYNGTNYVNRAIPTCTTGQYLFFNGTAWSCVTDAGGSVTSVSSANAYMTVATSATTPVLTLNVGTATNTLAAGNDSRIVGALQQTAFDAYVAPANCNANQTMYWNSVGSTFACQNIQVVGDVTGTASTTVVTKIQGFAVSATAPVAGQALVYNGTQWVPTTGFPRYVKLTATQAFATAASSNVAGLSFAVTAGKTYRFKFTVVYTTAATTTGGRFGLTFPAAADMAALVNVSNSGTDGTSAMYTGLLNSSGDSVISSGSSAGRNYGEVTGVITPTATGTLQLTAGTEIGGSAVTLQAGSQGEIVELP